MGSRLGWHCEKCGAEEEYSIGCGMLSFDVEETRSRIEKGEFGKLAKKLLAEGFPLEVHTIDESSFFCCSSCGKLVEGMSVRFFVQDDKHELMLHVPPDECPECGEGFAFGEDCIPVSEGEITAYVKGILDSGCPKCGSKDVGPILINWD